MDNSPLQPAEHFAAMLNCSPRHFAERVAKTPGFPAPLRKRNQVWFADEVIDWLRKHRAAHLSKRT